MVPNAQTSACPRKGGVKGRLKIHLFWESGASLREWLVENIHNLHNVCHGGIKGARSHMLATRASEIPNLKYGYNCQTSIKRKLKTKGQIVSLA